MLDWQLSRYLSPVIDFCHFMFVCTDKAFRDQYYQEFIGIYHETVVEHLAKLGCGSELFPFDVLQEHFLKHAKFVLFVTMMALPIICTPNEDLPDMAELVAKVTDESNTNKTEFIEAFKSENNKNYTSRMGDAIRDLVDYGYL